MTGLLGLPNELLLLTASFLDDANDKVALVKTCRRVYEVTSPDLYRFLAVDQHADAAFQAAVTGHTAILDTLCPYNPRLVNRYFWHDPDPEDDFKLMYRDPDYWDESFYPCPVCDLSVCKHPPYPQYQDHMQFSQSLISAVLGGVDLGRKTACFSDSRLGRFTLLHLAALVNDCDQICWLLDHGAYIDAPCAIIGCPEVLEEEDNTMLTALQLALCNRNVNAAKLLIERGACLDADLLPIPSVTAYTLEYCTPPFCVAAAFGVSDIVRLLLEKGIPIDQRSDYGYTALHHAADRCWEEEYFDVFKVLLDAGADIGDAWNAFDKTPLDVAFRNGNFAAVNHLLSLGASLDQLSGALGLGLLQFACAFEARGRALRYDMHSCFSNSRLDAEVFTKEKWEAGRLALVTKLLDLGYDVNASASLNHEWCEDHGDGKYLRPRGQIDQQWWESESHSGIFLRDRATALNAVSFDCGVDLIDLLIRRGADVNAQDSRHMTVLWLQCVNQDILDWLHPYWDIGVHGLTFPGCNGPNQKQELAEKQEKMALLLRHGAKLDPWANSISVTTIPAQRPSARALTLFKLVDTDVFAFLMANVTEQNISEEQLGYIAGELLCRGLFQKALIIMSQHGKVRVRLGTWREEISLHDINIEAHYMDAILTRHLPLLEDDVTEYLKRLLIRASEENEPAGAEKTD